MAGKARVSALAKELGVTSKDVLAKLQEMGEYVKSASSTIEAPVERSLRAAFPAAPAAPAKAPAKKVPAKKAGAAAVPVAECSRPRPGSAGCTGRGRSRWPSCGAGSSVALRLRPPSRSPLRPRRPRLRCLPEAARARRPGGPRPGPRIANNPFGVGGSTPAARPAATARRRLPRPDAAASGRAAPVPAAAPAVRARTPA